MRLFFYNTTIGRIGIAEQNDKITNLFFATEPPPHGVQLLETAVLKLAASQLQAYLEGSLQEFTLPLEPIGTDFMRRVWQALGEIPFGKTVSYKELAMVIGSPQASRAVGQANNRNPLPILIPCHRVIGADGKLAGYRGGIELKRKLLELEGVQF